MRTINRNMVATLDWNINQDWGLTLKVPYISRTHSHIFNADNGSGGSDPELERWSFSGLGDIQAIGRYNVYRDDHSSAGVRFGLKLPTGSIHKSNSEEKAERTLQPGSGSVDRLLGAYYNHRFVHLNWFVQSMWQQSVHDRDQFELGDKLGVDTGLSYMLTPDLNVLLQLNALHKSRDSGANAEPKDSGGSSVNLSPGLSYRVAPNTQVYGFVQKPIYQYVNGAQLTADWSLAVGINTLF